MKKNIVLIIVFWSMTALWAKPLYHIKLIKAADGIECSIGDLNAPNRKNKGHVSNTCWIDVGDALVIVDPGPTYQFAKAFAELAERRTGKPIKAVVVTNYHDDRLYGASYYAAEHIPIIAHRSIVEDIRNNPETFHRMPAVLSKKVFAKTKLILPDRLFDEKYVIKGKKRIVELLKLSAVSEEHSDIVVWVPDVKFLFAGNIVFNDRALNYTQNSDMGGWIEALKKIAAMKPATVLGGHGATMGPKAYAMTLKYLQTLQKQVKAAFKKDVDLSDLMRHLDLSEFKGLKHADRLNRHNAYNYYNQVEWE